MAEVICWLSPMSLDGILRFNKPCEDTTQITWENVINYSGNYDCVILIQCTCIYICNGFNYHLIHKYNRVTLDFNNKLKFFNKKKDYMLTMVVKKTGTMFNAFPPSV